MGEGLWEWLARLTEALGSSLGDVTVVSHSRREVMEGRNSRDIDSKRLDQVKENLRAGRLEREDLEILENLVERTELAAKQLRAAIVE